ncbi:MAG: TetR/AcrR family transcriptional regulator [Rhabdochlamydiaceae bacterium]|nr:TetR/AcrR family transcriptional regulator [Candidatus Amphrikana amoebophyrae]
MAKPANRREEIVKTAREIFLSKDYEQTTMAEIMKSLNIAKGTIYHYFKSKEALFEAVIETIVEENISAMKRLIEESNGNALDKIELLAKKGNISQENDKIVDQLNNRSNDAMHSRLLAATLMKQAPIYAKVIEQGCKEKLFKTDYPLECAEVILSAIQFLTDMGIYPWNEETLKRRIKAFPHIIEQLLQAPSGAFKFLTHQMNH